VRPAALAKTATTVAIVVVLLRRISWAESNVIAGIYQSQAGLRSRQVIKVEVRFPR
jgi:hypothetical protein